MNKKIWIYSDNKRLINYILMFNIPIYSSNSLRNIILYKIKYEDYLKLNNLGYLNIKIYSLSKIDQLINKIKSNIKYIPLLILFFINIFCLSKIIVTININNSDKYLNNLIKYELKNNGLKKLSLVKNYNSLNKIKKEILKNNKDKLEWMEIKRVGMTYEIYYEKRIINESIQKNTYCNIISKKDGIISSLIIYKGTPLITINDYVKKGDILVSGDITFNEDIVGKVCASANIYANTWYTIKITIPTYKYQNIHTNKFKYNIVIKNKKSEYKIFNSVYKDYHQKDKLILKLFNYKIYLRKEEKIIKEKVYLSEEELINIAIKKGLEKLNVSLDNNSSILEQNVLKKSINNSKMYIEVFVAVKENIAYTQVLE